MVSFDCSCSVSHRADNIYALYLRNEFDFWKAHGIMNTSGFSGFTLTLQETRRIHDYMNLPKLNLLLNIYILL